MPSTNRVSLTAYKKYIGETIKKSLDETWRGNMAEKNTLSRYRSFKKDRGTIDHLYDNSRGSRLLANARAGCLQTRKYRSRYTDIEVTCPKCEREEETLEHVILECENPPDAEYMVRKRIGLHEDSTPQAITTTKRTLEKWEKEATDRRTGEISDPSAGEERRRR